MAKQSKLQQNTPQKLETWASGSTAELLPFHTLIMKTLVPDYMAVNDSGREGHIFKSFPTVNLPSYSQSARTG